MNHPIAALALLFCAISYSACKQASSGTDSGGSDTGSDGGSSSTATLSKWSTQNKAWSMDFSVGNLSGTSFTLTIAYADTSTCSCTAALSGTDSSGSYTASGCYNPLGTTGMAGSNCGDFDTSGTGTYTNSGSSIKLCDSSDSCATYYP